MTYRDWFETHAEKHRAIVEKLLEKGCTEDEIIDYFDFDNMLRNEPDFCPLYAKSRKCHDMEQLNCYLCACPNFRFNDSPPADASGKKVHSHCAIDSKEGAAFESGNSVHQDCSACLVPHHKHYIQKQFDTDWKKIMRECPEED